MEISFSEKQTDFLCRLVFLIILVDLLFSAFSNTLIHQLQSPVLKFAYLDPAFWVMHLLRIPETITTNFFLSCFWDIMLFVSSIGVFIYPRKKWLIAVFIFFYFVYYIIFNSFGAHHTHSLIPFLIMPIAFLFSKKSFSFAWQGLRYFLLFSYSAAFFWKFFRFSWLQSDQGILIIKKNLTPYLFFNPHTFLANMYFWFLQNPGIVYTIYLAGFILEGFFIVGFFTKKFDRYLFIISLLLPFGFWFMADALFYEMAILSLTLLPVLTIARFQHYFSK
ncbi:MAG: hypothetical protein ABI136_05150 [Ginsengibacter sp.]